MIDGILITVGQLLLFGFLLLVGIPKTVANLCSSLLGIGYFVWMPVANSGQTLGKMAAGIAVVFAGGNGGPDAGTAASPASNPGALAVGTPGWEEELAAAVSEHEPPFVDAWIPVLRAARRRPRDPRREPREPRR